MSNTQALNINSGWNFVSFYVDCNFTQISGNNNILEVKNLTEVYNSTFFSFQNTLTTLTSTSGYWLNSSITFVLNLTGNLYTQVSYPIAPNWNLISFPFKDEIPLSNILTSDILEVKNLTEVYNSTFFSFQNTLINLSPGSAYWLNTVSGNDFSIISEPYSGDGLQQRTFNQPTRGVKFHTSFYRDTSLSEIRFDASDNISTDVSTKLSADISNALWSNEADKGVTVVSVQTISNEDFTKYLGAYTLQFSNWDFSANLPLDNYSALDNSNRIAPVGINGKNIFKKTETDLLWDGSANMMVGIPTDYIQDDSSMVHFPVAISDSYNNMNALNHTIDASNEFIDLYSILGRPKLEEIVIAYDQTLDAIAIGDLSFETHII